MSSAEQLREEAEKLESSKGGFFAKVFGGGADKLEEACDLYTRAGSRFKVDQKWSSAGECYEKASSLQMTKLDNKHEAAQNLVEAGNCWRKAEPKRATDCLAQAIEVYIDLGRASLVAKQHVTIAEIWEAEPDQIEKSIDHYRKASQVYRGEEQQSQANKCDLKAASMLALNKQFDQAVRLFEAVASNACESNLLKYSAKDYFFKAAICHFCQDTQATRSAIERYEEQFPSFADTREYELLQTLLEAAEADKIDDFSDAIKKYDSISRIDNWLTTNLLCVKKRLESEEEPCLT